MNPRDLLAFYCTCIRDAQVPELSSYGRFKAAHDAAAACALALQRDVDEMTDFPLQEALILLNLPPQVDERLAQEIRDLGRDYHDYWYGHRMAQEPDADRALQCALRIHAATTEWFRKHRPATLLRGDPSKLPP